MTENASYNRRHAKDPCELHKAAIYVLSRLRVLAARGQHVAGTGDVDGQRRRHCS